MPRMSGREAAQQIRKIEVGDSHIPIIALTAHGLSDERDKLLACGIDDYVGKPISQPQLLQVLQKWLGRTSTTQSLSTVTPADDINSIAPEVIDSASVSTLKSTPVDKPVPRPLSLKKIRDDYMRDIQPRDDYMREPQRVTQPRYQGLQYQDQLQESSSEQDGQSQEQSSKDNGWKSSAIDGLKVLDWEDALTRSANKPDLAAKLIIMMIDTIADEKDALAQAWQARDRNMLAQVAHRILGASRYTGVPQLRQASQDLEDKCLLNVQHTTPAQFAMLKPYHEALLLALTNLQMLDLSPYPQLTYHRLSENDMTWKMI